MSKNHSAARLAVLLLATLCLLFGGVAGAQESDDQVQQVRIKKIMKSCDGDDCGEGQQVRVKVIRDCDGDDCDEGEHTVVFVGDDGEHRVIEGSGGNVSWVSDDGGEHGKHAVRVMAHPGGGAFLGVQMTELTPELRTHFGVTEDAGVMVSKVVEDSPAFRAGIRVGDVISAVGGKRVASGSSLAKAIGGREAGEAVNIELWRDGRLQTLSATLEKPEMKKRSAMHNLHLEGGGDHASGANVFVIECDGDDCDSSSHELHFGDHDFGCGSGEECEVQVECENGDCVCTVNGQAAACPATGGN